MKLGGLHLRQRDGVSCGPAVAVVAGALLDAGYRVNLTDARFDAEQARVHAATNRIWPRALGTTPWGMARAIGVHGARYRWRLVRRGDALTDVRLAVTSNWPVAMLVGSDFPLAVPRHWVLIVEFDGETMRCYEPSSGEVRSVPVAAVRAARLTDLGFPRPFAFVLPGWRLGRPPGAAPGEPESNI